ncbi:hypothetical protein [Alteraurantiacibacter palmitatis]|uniref:UrcA family protein n=1 Tax=Alteraurantiacibacter palmitatis TaxID=2054628 RepID=A0ABV7E5Y5_9SPHN
MKTVLFAAAPALALASALSAPAAAQSVMIIKMGYDRAPRAEAALAADAIVAEAAERACPRPFLRNLRAQELYRLCLAEARAEAEAKLAARETPTELARR